MIAVTFLYININIYDIFKYIYICVCVSLLHSFCRLNEVLPDPRYCHFFFFSTALGFFVAENYQRVKSTGGGLYFPRSYAVSIATSRSFSRQPL